MPSKKPKTKSRRSSPAGPRAIWNGSISFGLLNVPVQLFPGERSVDLHFRMLDSRDKAPIRYERVNSETGEEVAWKEIVKAFEYAKGSYVVIDEEDLRKAAPEATETVEIETFVDAEQIDPRYFERPYFLVPGRKAEKGYVLLRETLRKAGKVGIARVVIRTRQYLAALKPHGDALILLLMRFPQELIPATEYHFPAGRASAHRISERELEMAQKLIESMSSDWKPDDYQDDFRARLRKIINAQIARQKGGAKARPAREEARDVDAQAKAASNVVDFTALLKKSLAGKSATGAEPMKKKASARRS
ncbi:MAG: Ku protein [Gammaproteobacteria bacterium]